jgi:CubicO group peptidase (beta-lactamase class C family)
MSLTDLPRTLSIIQDGIQSGLHPGAQMYVSLARRVVCDDAIGLARDGVPMTRDTLTLWMSAGKPVTAVAVLQLVDRGLIALDTRVAEVIPEFGQNGKAAITLRHILTHTAGFRGPLNNFTPGTWDEILQRVYALKQEAGWVPGDKAGYHIGSSWFVLGELVRRLDGRSIDRFVHEEIFSPLGEPEASIGIDPDVYDGQPTRWSLVYDTSKESTPEWQGNTREANTLPRPGANARGPIRALGQMYERLLAPSPPDPLPEYRERELISAPLARAMTSRQRAGMLDQTFKQTLDWGLGVMVDSKQYAGEHAYGFGPHASADTFGHSGNQSSCGFFDPAHELVVAWTCNGMPGEAKHQARASAINAAIYEDLALARPATHQ